MKTSFEDLQGKVCVITGGCGVIGRSLCDALTGAGVRLAVTARDRVRAEKTATLFRREGGPDVIGVEADVLDRAVLERACREINQRLGPIDFLVNCAGGNAPQATTKLEFLEPSSGLEGSFFGLDIAGFREAFDLNFFGTLLPTMVFTRDMVRRQGGVVLNFSSMNALRPLTKIPAYSAAKASVNNFTQWLAVHLARVGVRVNAIAPGFILTSQNRFLLTEEQTGELTRRGQRIIEATPMGRFGSPEDLHGATLFLLSDVSRFVTGVVFPVDGGFSAYSGV